MMCFMVIVLHRILHCEIFFIVNERQLWGGTLRLCVNDFHATIQCNVHNMG